MGRWIRILGAGALAAAFVGAAGTTAQAGPPVLVSYQPDARIAKGSGPYVGDGVINLTAEDQTIDTHVAPGKSKTFYLRVKNAGVLNGGDTFFVFTNCNPSDQSKCKFFYKGNNVTNKVNNGSFNFKGKVIPLGESTPKLEIKFKAQDNAEGSLFDTVTTKSGTDDDERDVVGLSIAFF